MSNVPFQMIETFLRQSGIFASLCQDETALQNRLCMTGKARRRPVGCNAVLAPRLFDVIPQCRCMAEHAVATGIANIRHCLENLLRHRADEASEFL